MAIFRGSRYENCTFIGVRDKGITKKFLDERIPFNGNELTVEHIKHKVKAGEELDLISYMYYGDETLWGLIADINDLFFIYDLVPGQDLIIPDKRILETNRDLIAVEGV